MKDDGKVSKTVTNGGAMLVPDVGGVTDRLTYEVVRALSDPSPLALDMVVEEIGDVVELVLKDAQAAHHGLEDTQGREALAHVLGRLAMARAIANASIEAGRRTPGTDPYADLFAALDKVG